MNDLPLYHETFEALKVHEHDRDFADTAKSLFQAAFHASEWNGSVDEHLAHKTNTPRVSQLFFENTCGEGRYEDALTISAMPNALIYGIVHFDKEVRNDGYRSSLVIENHSARTYFNDIMNLRSDSGSSERHAVEDFKNRFYAVTAAMSLLGHVKRLDTHEAIQNDSVSAIFAKAA